MNDLFQLLNRSRGLAGGSLSRGRVQPGRRYLGVVYSGGTLPTSANRFHLTHPVSFSGTESEGSTGTLTADTSVSVPVLVLDGPASVGDYLVADLIDGRWVAELIRNSSGGGSTGALPGCSCSTAPTPLTLTLSGTVSFPFDPLDYPTTTTMSYRNLSAFDSVFGAGTQFFWSDTMFTNSGGLDYYILLECGGSQFGIHFAYPVYPFVDSRFYVWNIGSGGNQCSGPFQLISTGGMFFGGPPVDYSVT